MSQYLDRNQVIELYKKYQPSLANNVYEFGEELKALTIVEIPLAELDTTNDFAEWVKFTLEGGFLSSHKCSNCGFHGNQLWHYCPNCGADMRPRILDEDVDGEGKDGNMKEGETKTKKCPNCGSDLYEYCFMCCYEGKKVERNDSRKW